MNNPLMSQHELPPFKSIKAEHVEPAIKQMLDKNRSEIKALLKSGADNWETLVAKQDDLDDQLNQAWSPVSHMNSVVNSDELREAYNN